MGGLSNSINILIWESILVYIDISVSISTSLSRTSCFLSGSLPCLIIRPALMCGPCVSSSTLPRSVYYVASPHDSCARSPLFEGLTYPSVPHVCVNHRPHFWPTICLLFWMPWPVGLTGCVLTCFWLNTLNCHFAWVCFSNLLSACAWWQTRGTERVCTVEDSNQRLTAWAQNRFQKSFQRNKINQKGHQERFVIVSNLLLVLSSWRIHKIYHKYRSCKH